MSAIYHFLIKKNKMHHLDTVNISELQGEHPCGCMPSHTFVDSLCTQIRNQNRIWMWIGTRSQGVCDTWLKCALIIIWGRAMVPLLSLLLVIVPAVWRLNFTVNVPICFIPHKNCSYLLLGGLICLTFYTREQKKQDQTHKWHIAQFGIWILVQPMIIILNLQQLLLMVADMIVSLWSHMPHNFSSW